MKRILFVFAFALITSLTFAQKVKIKKGVVLMDDVEIFKEEKEGDVQTFSTISGKEFMSVIGTSYQERNEAHYRKYGENFPRTITKWIYTVKFFEYGKELVTDLSTKDIIKAVFQSEMVKADGKIDEAKLNVFVNKYHNENLKYKL